TVWFGNGEKIADSIKYKYDSCGNICRITENGHVVAKYTYDSLNRLIREDNKQLNKTVMFSYDRCGNITERCEYPYTSKSGEELAELNCTHYSYDYNGDKLVNYNGETFVYNTLGCPTTYRGKTATWQYGKMLASYNGVSFAYDGLGRRISKNGITFTYDNDGRLINQSNGLEFIYDNAGVAGVKYNDKTYFYRKDVQGNIIAILDSTGAVVVKYEYDAWGKHTVKDNNGRVITSGIGVLNPFRYRGYYYDTETELYYLQTRYYDPEIGRFISQDSIEYADPETINGLNLYAYCGNNPVMNVDPTGTSFLVALIVGAIIAGLVAGTLNAAAAAYNGESVRGCVGAFFGGFITGAVLGAATILGGGLAVGAITVT
ncbi:MAG: RHS repeat-associated core domain-containing protein, partial [Clostridia bacterium]|nr:RHS repeat-associated core domain-containing protein [Clostridia bacterium]